MVVCNWIPVLEPLVNTHILMPTVCAPGRFCSSLWLLLAFLLLGFPSLLLGQEARILEIEIQGTSELEEAQLLFTLESQVNFPLDRQRIRQDIRQIFETGLFRDVRAEVEPLGGANHHADDHPQSATGHYTAAVLSSAGWSFAIGFQSLNRLSILTF